MDSSAQREGIDKRISSQKDNLVKLAKPRSSNAVEHNDRQSVNSVLNKVAQNIRNTDKTMKKVEIYIDRMQDNLLKIVKQFPPFPRGSEERVRILNSFQSLRKQIDQLTIPPKGEYAVKIMADPDLVPEAGDWDIELSNGLRKTIRSRQVHSGPTGLNLPELSEKVDDEKIQAAVKGLDAAKATLRQRQYGLYVDTVNIKHSRESDAIFNQSGNLDEPESTYADAGVELKSIELKQSLTNKTDLPLISDQSQLMGLLN